MLDVLIVGAGVVGCAVARELSRYALDVAVLEREEDVGAGTSKANSAIIHAGFDAEPGTLKARFNVEGCARMGALSQELDIPFRRNGSLVVALTAEDLPKLTELKARGEKNGVPELRILSGSEARKMEPALADGIAAALYAPTAGIVCPFELTQALAENACINGVQFHMNTRVEQVEAIDGGYRVRSDRGTFDARIVVNCAGLYSDEIHNQLCDEKLHIVPRRGEYMLLDRKAGALVDKTIFQCPGKLGKGVLVTPTVHGNLMIGPTAEDIDDREATCTTAEGLAKAASTASLSVPELPLKQVITSFAGLRAHLDGEQHDFRIGEPRPGYFEAAGIESPGLTAAPAIGAHLAGWSRWDEAAELFHSGEIYADLSSSLYALTPEHAATLIRSLGTDRVMFGTDYPMWSAVDELERLDRLPLTEQERQDILYRNAVRLLGITGITA